MSAARLATATLLVLAAGAAEGAAQQANVVSGTVRTADGRPIVGATIRVSGSVGAARGTTVRTQTDANGNYRVEVRPGHYDVDAFADLTYDGQTYRELWLDRTNEGCERQLSQNGIVRHFVLRLSGLMKCTANLDPNEPTSYYGGALALTASGLPASSTVRITATPTGPLADGSAGRTLVFERTGPMLERGGGRLGETSFLHDIPLGRYRVSAEVRSADGSRRALTLRNPETGKVGTDVEVSFRAGKMFPYGFQTASLIVTGSSADVSPSPQPQPAGPTPPPPSRAEGTGLPTGSYVCSYMSPYAGPIPTGRSIEIVDGNRYEAWGGTGEYVANGASIQWRSGPLAERGVSVSFDATDGRPVLTVRGGAAAEDPDGTNQCVRSQ